MTGFDATKLGDFLVSFVVTCGLANSSVMQSVLKLTCILDRL